ncbi:MAG: hypothetical protein Q8S00_32315 [Deltaproteobacteria bacterium]|nr:hypothetical protein [Deltaproteobacteria bacterium]
MLRSIRCWDDLKPFGINCLTGEACGYAMRLLCDVTERGAEIVERYLGGTVQIKRGSNWNGGSSDDPHVGSVLLARDSLISLGAFCLLRTRTDSGSAIILLKEAYGGYLVEYSAESLESYRELYQGRNGGNGFEGGDSSDRFEARIARYYARPSVMDPERHTHAMSGRTI